MRCLPKRYSSHPIFECTIRSYLEWFRFSYNNLKTLTLHQFCEILIFVSYFECPVCNAQLWNISLITRVFGIFIPNSIFSSFIICLFNMLKLMKVRYEILIWQLIEKCPVCNNYLLNFVDKRSSLNCDHKETNHKQL